MPVYWTIFDWLSNKYLFLSNVVHYMDKARSDPGSAGTPLPLCPGSVRRSEKRRNPHPMPKSCDPRKHSFYSKEPPETEGYSAVGSRPLRAGDCDRPHRGCRMQRPSSSQPPIGSLALIAAVVAAGAGLFAFTAGWLSPGRLTPTRFIEALAPPSGPALGHRRNHAKGICFTGVLESNGAGAALSRGPGFHPRPISGPGALQSRHARSERAGREGPGARHGAADLDARTARNGAPP